MVDLLPGYSDYFMAVYRSQEGILELLTGMLPNFIEAVDVLFESYRCTRTFEENVDYLGCFLNVRFFFFRFFVISGLPTLYRNTTTHC